MTIKTNTTDRKALAKALADELGITPKYMGPPTFVYQVGDYTVNRDGNIYLRIIPVQQEGTPLIRADPGNPDHVRVPAAFMEGNSRTRKPA